MAYADVTGRVFPDFATVVVDEERRIPAGELRGAQYLVNRLIPEPTDATNTAGIWRNEKSGMPCWS